MVGLRQNPHVVILFTVVVFLMLRQSTSQNQNGALKFDKNLADINKGGPSKPAQPQAKEAEKPKPGAKKHGKKGPFDSVDSLLDLQNALKKSPNVPPNVKEGCKIAESPELCEGTMVAHGKNVKSLDPSGILETSANALSHALNTARAAASDPSMGVSSNVAGSCKQSYKDALDASREGTEESKNGDSYLAGMKLSAALTNIETCKDSIAGATSSKLARLNDVLLKLAINTMSLK